MSTKNTQSSTASKSKPIVMPAFDQRVFWRSTIITFIIGFIGFLILFIYIAKH